MHLRFRVTVADSTGGTLGPEETSGADQRTALPTASPSHALQTCRRCLRNGNNVVITPVNIKYIQKVQKIFKRDVFLKDLIFKK